VLEYDAQVDNDGQETRIDKQTTRGHIGVFNLNGTDRGGENFGPLRNGWSAEFATRTPPLRFSGGKDWGN